MSKNGWTPERRKRQSETIKRWKPWEQSTGAKTNQGKEKSKMNALKHGARSIAWKSMALILKKLNNVLLKP
jgi:hypothetical protein